MRVIVIANDIDLNRCHVRLARIDAEIRWLIRKAAWRTDGAPELNEKIDWLKAEVQQLDQAIVRYHSPPDLEDFSVSIDQLKEIGPKLIEARAAIGWTQADLARALGVSRQRITKLESSGYQTATLTTVCKVWQVLRAS